MTSLRQIEANRRNALRSTGPKTDDGKHHASRNAVRHGLTAETVITPLEDPEDYKAFEQAVTADYEAETAVERELVLRLASLLWRLRRATSIETGLLQIQEEMLPQALANNPNRAFPRPRSYDAILGPANRPAASPKKARTRTATPRRYPTLGLMLRGASYASPISTTACSSGSAGMKRRYGVK